MPAKVMPVSMSLRSIPDFRRLLWVGFVASTVRWLEMLAMALFAYKATDSALAVVMLVVSFCLLFTINMLQWWSSRFQRSN